MRLLPALLALLVVSNPTALADKALSASALKILEAYHADAPESAPRKLHLVCWHPADRDPWPHYHERLTGIMEHIQNFYADEMERLGLGRRSFNLDYDENGRLVVHVVKGQGAFRDYQKPDGGRIRDECLPTLQEAGIRPDRETILIFTTLSEWNEEKKTFRHKSPYYASGSYRQGTAWQLDSPELAIGNLSRKEPMIKDGEYGRISLGKHNTIFIGGIAHELGHALGLPHNKATEEEARAHGTALMGAGNQTYFDELRDEGMGSFLTMVSALRLASHPQFSGSTKGLWDHSHSDVQDLSLTTDGKRLVATGKVVANPPCYALVAYADPEGHGDYDAVTAAAVPDEEGRFELSIAPSLEKSGELRLFVLHANGAVSGHMSSTPFRYPYGIQHDGPDEAPRVSLDAYHKHLAFQPLVQALRSGHIEEAKLALSTLDAGERDTGRQLMEGDPPVLHLEALAPERKLVPLSTIIPQEATVGWGTPTYNRTPDERLLLQGGHTIFTYGIYAHAPATHRYALGGKWNSLSGLAGLAAGRNGSVHFEILGDEKPLWTSGTVRQGEPVRFRVDLEGVQELTLVTTPTEDGNASDWGMWFEPMLQRK